jgi:sodium/bile acid cotransporter 7
MREFFRRHWFLTTLAALIVCGMTQGALGHGPWIEPAVKWIDPRWTTAVVLVLMSFSLDSEHLWAAFRAPRPVVIGFLMNYGLAPLLAWGLMGWQEPADFRVGLMIAASVPCTMAAASVMTRKAGGNDAVSLLTTVATNMVCFLLTPLWLQLTTATQVQLPVRRLMIELLEGVLLPTLAGQLLRQPAGLREFAVRHKTGIGVIAQILIEVLVFTAALRAGTALHRMQVGTVAVQDSARESAADQAQAPRSVPARSIGVENILVSWVSAVFIHVVALSGGWWLARWSGSAHAEAAAVAFAGSQKTLPIGLMISTDPGLFGSAFPFAMFPMLLYHTSQLFFDTWLASRMGRASR